MPSPYPPQPDPALLDIEAIIAAHSMTDAVAGKPLVASPLPPLSAFATYIPYRKHLLALVRQQPRTALGWATHPHESPLARFIAHTRIEARVAVWRGVIVINDVRYAAPAWVRALLLAEQLYGARRLLCAEDALRILDIVLEDLERRQEARDAATKR